MVVTILISILNPNMYNSNGDHAADVLPSRKDCAVDHDPGDLCDRYDHLDIFDSGRYDHDCGYDPDFLSSRYHKYDCNGCCNTSVFSSRCDCEQVFS